MHVPSTACCVGGPMVVQPTLTKAQTIVLAAMTVLGVLTVLAASLKALV